MQKIHVIVVSLYLLLFVPRFYLYIILYSNRLVRNMDRRPRDRFCVLDTQTFMVGSGFSQCPAILNTGDKKSEREAVEIYTQENPPHYKAINSALTTWHTHLSNPQVMEKYESIIFTLDSFLSQNSTFDRYPLTVYRGCANVEWPHIKQGNDFVFKSFQSCSLNPDVARSFGELILVITIPHPGLARNVSSWSKFPNEHEVTLRPFVIATFTMQREREIHVTLKSVIRN